MKKVLWSVVAGLMLVIASSCGGTKPAEEPTPAGGEQQSTEAPAQAEGGTQ